MGTRNSRTLTESQTFEYTSCIIVLHPSLRLMNTAGWPSAFPLETEKEDVVEEAFETASPGGGRRRNLDRWIPHGGRYN